MTKIRWGVLSTARIGLNKVIPAIQAGTRGEVTAISSRHLETAQAAAARLGLQKFYGSYDALLADPEIDAIYNPLPNHLHVSWSIKALEAGKHVLCEKPIGITAEDGHRLLTATRHFPQLKVIEAFMYRHHPQWQRAYELVRTEAIGPLRAIQSVFSYFNNDAADIRNQAALGGGALLDIGCYPVSLSRWLFAAEPQRVFGVIDRDPRFETDRHASAILEFPAGTSTLLCSTQQAPYQRVQILGERGSIEIEIPF
ncbi:MAG: Gfo/Idh/MocA family oxidoreductase, partial [Pseudomonadota bacterium]|nr:Gfo/Idh/MocA family oxidoreductase [Pseudomonadota bacterium]